MSLPLFDDLTFILGNFIQVFLESYKCLFFFQKDHRAVAINSATFLHSLVYSPM